LETYYIEKKNLIFQTFSCAIEKHGCHVIAGIIASGRLLSGVVVARERPAHHVRPTS
jgi:heme/copper-type cytochrome/quinol oxidase subunit 3